MVFSSWPVNHFFAEFSFNSPIEISATLKLPEGHGIYQDSYNPKEGVVSSDGRRVVLSWEAANEKDVLFFSKFEQLNREFNPWIIFSIALVAALLFSSYYFKKKRHKEFLTGFTEDEKKTIEYLKERKLILQSDLEKEFRFSRAKSTRVVYRLENEGLLAKKKKGRTNMLTWKK